MISTDAVIVGAGPCGLFAAFELGLLGLDAHIVETLDEPGGQCVVLYPEKPIYDIPALPVVLGRELIDRLLQQIAPFQTPIHLQHEVVELQAAPGAGFRLRCSGDLEFHARAVIIAGGIGSFQPRPLRLPEAERHEGVDLHYRVTSRERFRGRRLAVLGGGDSALDWVLDLHGLASAITLVHRREEFRAAPASVERMKALARADPQRLSWRVGHVTQLLERDGGALGGIEVSAFHTAAEDVTPERVECDELLVFFGLSPNLGPIAEWGLQIDKRHLEVNPETQQTSTPGIFAVGDISTYPGKKKLILSGFHEATLAAYGVQKFLDPDAKQTVQYTTTSSALHKRLGVET
jgi:thioredoxin reductase (NADPH)